MNLLVRFEVDAVYPSFEDSSVDELVSKAASLSLSKDFKKQPEPIVSNGLSIISSGNDKLSEQKDIIELTSKSLKARAKFRWGSKYGQLYLSATPHFVVGVHEAGNFGKIEKYGTDDDSSIEMRRAREKIQPGLNKLAAMLAAIHAKVMELTDDDATGSREDRLLALVHKDRTLSMYERTGGPKLPDELIQCFESS